MISPNHDDIKLAVATAIMNAKNSTHTPRVSGVVAAERAKASEIVVIISRNDI